MKTFYSSMFHFYPFPRTVCSYSAPQVHLIQTNPSTPVDANHHLYGILTQCGWCPKMDIIY